MKRLVVCADGTWNEPSTFGPDGKPCPTNVVRFAQAVAPSDAGGVAQEIFYHAGVGTHPGIDHFLGGVFGIGLDRNICDLYRFLVHNFEPGDELFLLGFSRGAFTVRSLAGMIRKCGILAKHEVDEVKGAFDFYRSDVLPTDDEAVAYRREHSRETRIKCIGVWDTVGALGIPVTLLRYFSQRKYRFHDVKLSTFVDNAFQALAIDERRAPFKPTLWDAQPPDPAHPQRVEQVWFTGVHSDIGGGYPSTDLSDLTLAWMIERTKSIGLAFLADAPSPVGDPCGTLHDSMTSWYALLGDGTRELGLPTPQPPAYPATFECLSDPALRRYDEFCKRPTAYAPWNVTRYLARTGIREPC